MGHDIELIRNIPARNIPGFGMYSADERELDEVRVIEEGLGAAYDRNTKRVVEAFDKLKEFALRLIYLDFSAEHELDAKALIVAMGDIGKITAENRMEIASVAASRALGEVCLEAALHEREALTIKALSVLGSLSRELAGKGLDRAAKSAAESLGAFGKAAAMSKKEDHVSLAEIYLMQLASKALDEHLPEAGPVAVCLLGEVGAASSGQALEESAMGAAILLEDLGAAAVRNKHETQVKAVIHAFGLLGEAFSLKEQKIALVQAAWSLETIRLLALEYDMKTAAREAKVMLDSLKTAGILDEEQNLEKIQDIRDFHQRVLKKS